MVARNYNVRNYQGEIGYREPIVRDRAITHDSALGFGRAVSYGARYGTHGNYATNNGSDGKAYKLAELLKGEYVDTGGSGGNALGAVPTRTVFI